MIITREKSQQLRQLGCFFTPETIILGNSSFGYGCRTCLGGSPLYLLSSSLGIYSYTCSSLWYCQVGNYCSIGRFSGVGGQHPLDRLTTSTITYAAPNYSFSKKEAWSGSTSRTSIGHDVWIGMLVTIKAGVHIGNGAVIGANSVVTHDVPDFAIMVGAPAKVMRMRFSDSLIERIEKSQWFLYDWQSIEIEWSHPDQALDTMEKFIAEGKAPQAKFYVCQADDKMMKVYACGKANA